jgi:hypothetical protein
MPGWNMFLKRTYLHWIALLIFIIAVLYITFPLAFQLTQLTTGYGDEFLIAWIMNWNMQSLLTNPFQLFHANIFYPYQNTLAYSDIHLTASLLAMLPTLVLDEPMVASNITLITSLCMLGFFTYLLVYSLTHDFLSSLLAGLLLIFSPVVLDKWVHLQVLAVQWIPLAILFYIKFLHSKKAIFLSISLLFFLMQTYNSFLPGYFLVVIYIVLTLYYFFTNKSGAMSLFTKTNIIIVLITGLLLIPVVIPYYQVSNKFSYTRDIREAIHLSMQPEDLLTPSSFSRLYDIRLPFSRGENYPPYTEIKPGFIGLVFSLLAIATVVSFLWHYKKHDFRYKSFVSAGIVGLVMSFGPVLHLNRVTVHEPFIIPLPYAIFYYILPGLKGFRNVFRWEMLFVLMMAVAIGILTYLVFNKLPNSRKLVFYGVLFLLIIVEFRFPMQFQEAPQKKEFPAVYHWLRTTPEETAIAIMPIYNWNMIPYASDELKRVYYSTVHYRKMMNGASGFSPPPWQTMVTNIASEFPDSKSIKTLKGQSITYIVVHKAEYDTLAKQKFSIGQKAVPSGDEVINQLQKEKAVTFVKKFRDDYIFKIN